jgi:glycosyltransferase involved in cell wall biosynthesis
MTPAPHLPLSIAIPTYGREAVLLDTVNDLLALQPPAAEILLLDQTPAHEPATQARLRQLEEGGHIRWIRLATPSITAAMNRGLLEASQEIVLFVDDDIHPEPELLVAHVAAHADRPEGLVAGRVIQPWEENCDPRVEGPFRFVSDRPALITEFMGGNFSVHRQSALRLGGFDENFVRVAYRFEAEFAQRYCRTGRQIYFEPRACLHHLKATTGGTAHSGSI